VLQYFMYHVLYSIACYNPATGCYMMINNFSTSKSTRILVLGLQNIQVGLLGHLVAVGRCCWAGVQLVITTAAGCTSLTVLIANQCLTVSAVTDLPTMHCCRHAMVLCWDLPIGATWYEAWW